MSAILQLCQYTNLHGFLPMVQYAGYVHLGINSKKNPALKIFQCLQFSNFVNLRIYAVFHLWYNMQDMYIWKSTAKKSSFKKFSLSPILQFCQSTNLWSFSPMVQYSVYVHFLLTLQKFQCVQFLQFCQSTNLRGFSPMVQFSGSVHLDINNSTGEKIQL